MTENEQFITREARTNIAFSVFSQRMPHSIYLTLFTPLIEGCHPTLDDPSGVLSASYCTQRVTLHAQFHRVKLEKLTRVV